MTAKEHNRLLSIFFFVQGGLQLMGGLLLGIIYAGVGSMMLAGSSREDEQVMGGVFIGLGVFVAFLMLLFAGFDILVGFKLLKERAIGRTLGIVASIISLLNVPIGTALGVYGLWFLFGDKGKELYALAGNGGQQMFNPPPQPPPNSWR